MYMIKVTKEFGRGLYATETIKEGQVVTECEVLVLSPEDTVKVNQTDLQYYTFVFDEQRDCLVLGDGEIFNHSDTPNVAYKLVNYQGRKLMHFVATKTIKEDEQLFTDYNADVKVDTTAYIETKSLL